jgi:hypothetical protein
LVQNEFSIPLGFKAGSKNNLIRSLFRRYDLPAANYSAEKKLVKKRKQAK